MDAKTDKTPPPRNRVAERVVAKRLYAAEQKRFAALKAYLSYAKANPRIQAEVYKYMYAFVANCEAQARDFRGVVNSNSTAERGLSDKEIGDLHEHANFLLGGSKRLRDAMALPESDHLDRGRCTREYESFIGELVTANKVLHWETLGLVSRLGVRNNGDRKDMGEQKIVEARIY